MNVTRHNFHEVFGDLKKEIESPHCRFIAIDTEFTGLSPNEFEKEKFIDTLEERFRKVKRAGESFLVTQFGLSAVHVNEQHEFSIKTWNFYVFPRPYGSSDERFLCQASSLQFLSEHGFDFNKFIGEGIPFLNLAKCKPMRERLEKRIENLNKPNKNLSLSEEGLAFQKEVENQIDDWLANGNGRNGTKLVVKAHNSFYRMVIHETVRAKANYLYSETVAEGVEVQFVSVKVKEQLLAARAKEMRDEMEEAVGFTKVIELLSKSKKPVIGHNALLDFVYVFNQFYKPLPETLAEFKDQLLTCFPTIYDTKHLALRSPLGAKLTSTSLGFLFEYMRANVKPAPETLISSDPQFDAYRRALEAEADSDSKLLCHEAGFDAFMTGACFLGLLAHDNSGEVSLTSIFSDKSQFEKRLGEMETMKNRLNLMISDEAFLDLANAAQTIDRSKVYRVSTTDRKRRLQQVPLENLVEQPNKINRVVREGDRDAFVFLSEPIALQDDATVSKLGVTVTPFEEYHSTRAQKKQSVATTATPPPPTEHTASQTTDDATWWNRCTIS